MFRSKSQVTEHQLDTIRRLIGYAEMLSEVVKGSQLDEYVQDAIGDGEYLLKQLGGVASRSKEVGSYPALANA